MQKHVTLNEALTRLDVLVHVAVVSRGIAEQPSSPAEGATYLLPEEATGTAWSHMTPGCLVQYENGAWSEHPTPIGMVLHVIDEEMTLVLRSSGWASLSGTGGPLQNIDFLGVGTAADEQNPFSAKLNTALWTALEAEAGGTGDLRYVMNKQGDEQVLSLLFQSGYEGRAEIGLIGEDDLGLKVSVDGAAWIEALKIDRASGAVSVTGAGALISPPAVTVVRAFAYPPGRRRAFLVDDLIADLERAGIWSKLDVFYVLAAPDSQSARINWRDPGVHDLTAVSSPSFHADSGYQGNGVNAHLSAGVALGSLTHYALNDATLFAWSLSDLSDTNAYEIGTSGAQTSAIRARNLAGNFAVRANADNNVTASVSDSLGLFAFSRNAASSVTLYSDGQPVGSDANSSSSIGAGVLTLLKSGSDHSPRRIAAAGCGAALTAQQHVALEKALSTYLRAVGAL